LSQSQEKPIPRKRQINKLSSYTNDFIPQPTPYENIARDSNNSSENSHAQPSLKGRAVILKQKTISESLMRKTMLSNELIQRVKHGDKKYLLTFLEQSKLGEDQKNHLKLTKNQNYHFNNWQSSKNKDAPIKIPTVKREHSYT